MDFIPPEILIEAYTMGLFPMAHEDGGLYWHDPDPRAIFPLQDLRPDRKTAAMMRSGKWRISMDASFEEVIRACAAREETWIDERIMRSYLLLHEHGHAHSVEVWEGQELVGGIYGVAIGAAFFGESMFNRRPNAGKVAFHGLVDHLRGRGFMLFDTQYINPFTERLGAVEIAKLEYMRSLKAALKVRPAGSLWHTNG